MTHKIDKIRDERGAAVHFRTIIKSLQYYIIASLHYHKLKLKTMGVKSSHNNDDEIWDERGADGLSHSLDPSFWLGQVYKLKFWESVCRSVIASTFPILSLQIIQESSQTPYDVRHWKEDNNKETQKDKYKDKKR